MRECIDKSNRRNVKNVVIIVDEANCINNSIETSLLDLANYKNKNILLIFNAIDCLKVPVSIKTKCQMFKFSKIDIASIVNYLKWVSVKENISIDEQKLCETATFQY